MSKRETQKKRGDTHPSHELENLLTSDDTSWASSAPNSSHPLCAQPSHHGGHASTQRVAGQASRPEHESPLIEVLSPWVWDGKAHSRPPSLLLDLRNKTAGLIQWAADWCPEAPSSGRGPGARVAANLPRQKTVKST